MHVLVTRRLTLRAPHWLDADDIAAGLSDWNVARMLAAVPYPYHLEDAEEWLGATAADDTSLVYTIHRERLIGAVSLRIAGNKGGLGYWLAARSHGQGFMTEALAAVLAHAFREHRLTQVTAGVFLDNPASLRVQEKLGFRLTGLGETFSRPRGVTVQALRTRLARQDFETRGKIGALAVAA